MQRRFLFQSLLAFSMSCRIKKVFGVKVGFGLCGTTPNPIDKQVTKLDLRLEVWSDTASAFN